MVDIIYYGSERALICSRHCGIGSCRSRLFREVGLSCGFVTLVSGRCSCGKKHTWERVGW